MVMHFYSGFSMWIYSNALYNTLWGTFARLLYGAVHNLFNVTSRIHRSAQNRMSDARPQHRELHALRIGSLIIMNAIGQCMLQ